jgi:hypothetical protein
MASCWPSYAVIVFFIAVFFYDVVYKQWNDFASHGIVGLIVVMLVTLSCVALGDTITGFLLLVPLLAIILYVAIEAGKEKPTLEIKPPAPPPSTCIDPCEVEGCQKLVQVLVPKEESALARCRARLSGAPSTSSSADTKKKNTSDVSSGTGGDTGGTSGGTGGPKEIIIGPGVTKCV